MRHGTRKITYCAVLLGISILCMLLCRLTSLKTPLLICSLCVYISLQKGGTVLGLITGLSACILVALMGFLSTSLQTLVVFVPLGIIGYFARGLTYKKAAHIAIRAAIMVAFANIALACCYFFAKTIVPEIDIDALIASLGGYYVLAILASLIMIITDFLFWQASIMLKRVIK